MGRGDGSTGHLHADGVVFRGEGSRDGDGCVVLDISAKEDVADICTFFSGYLKTVYRHHRASTVRSFPMKRSSSLSSTGVVCLQFQATTLALKSPATLVRTSQMGRRTVSILSSEN